MTPACFPSQSDYQAWRDPARIAREPATICDDCTPAYRAQMMAERRCFPVAAEAMAHIPFDARGRKNEDSELILSRHRRRVEILTEAQQRAAALLKNSTLKPNI